MDWAIAAVAAAALAVRLRGDGPEKMGPWPGLLRIAAGLAIWFTIARTAPFSLSPEGNQLALPMVLAWVAVLGPAGVRESDGHRFLRVFVCFLALAETLQVYPVAGSQIGIAAVTFVAVGAICLSDGLRQLRAWSVAEGGVTLRRTAAITSVAGIALAGAFAYDIVVRPGTGSAVAYYEMPSLDLPGAELVHLPEDTGGDLPKAWST